jgi:hypothetical protein
LTKEGSAFGGITNADRDIAAMRVPSYSAWLLRPLAFVALATLLPMADLAVLSADAADIASAPSLADLPDFDVNTETYRIDPFIRAAVAMQSLGPSAALNELRAMAHTESNAARISVLCRMLFTPKADSTLRPPFLGAPVFLDGTIRLTSTTTWPLEPIEIVDGVPFLIVKGYELAGLPENAEAYLRHCEENGEWSSVRYSKKTEKQKSDALEKLLASPLWKAPLGSSERAFLRDQLQ